MKKEIDARGLFCPEPVVLTKKALDEYDEVTVIVNEKEPEENVRRLAESMGCRVSFNRRGVDMYLTITKPAQPVKNAPPSSAACMPATGPTVVAIGSDRMGSGNDELGSILMKSFIHTLTDVDKKPDIMIFFNTGVKLAIQGSEVLDDLEDLSQKGAVILVCGTCLGYFEIKDKLAAGKVSNMYEISETMLQAGKLVRI